MCTAYAHLKLYGYLEQLQENVLHRCRQLNLRCERWADSPLNLDNYLGIWQTSWEVIAFRNLKRVKKKTKKTVVLRIEGITQTQECCDLVNLTVLVSWRKVTCLTLKSAIETPQHNIKRDNKGFLLKNSTFLQRFRVVYNKRRRFPTGRLYPLVFRWIGD